MTSPETGGGSNTMPLSIEPEVEGGISSLVLPRNYFIIFDVRKLNEIRIPFLAKNLMSDGLEIYGNGAFQYWEIVGSICVRAYSTEVQLSRFVEKTKESM